MSTEKYIYVCTRTGRVKDIEDGRLSVQSNGLTVRVFQSGVVVLLSRMSNRDCVTYLYELVRDVLDSQARLADTTRAYQDELEDVGHELLLPGQEQIIE